MTERLAVIDPWTETEVWSGEASSTAEVEDAVARAAEAWATWKSVPTWARAAKLRQLAHEVDSGSAHLVDLLIQTLGKPRRAAQVEVRRTVEMLRRCAHEVLSGLHGETLTPDSVPGGEGRWSMTMREPYGVAALITPFNAPLNLLMQKLGPALAVGNAAVVKPSVEGTPVTEELVELMAPHLPEGLVGLLRGGPPVVLQLVADSRVRVVSLTGGTVAGRAVLGAAGIKPVHLELGSNSPNIVLADADIPEAARKIAQAAFEASGQQCISAQRILVAEQVVDDFISEFVGAAGRLVIGDPRDERTQVGPMIHAGSAERVIAMIDDAEARGARLALDGRLHTRNNVRMVGPTVIVDPPSSSTVMCEEAFGPLAAVRSVADLDEGIEVANDVPGLLQASCFTQSLDAAAHVARALWAGSVWINEATRFRLDMHPFGGTGSSGLGREGVQYALEAFTQVKHVGVSTS